MMPLELFACLDRNRLSCLRTSIANSSRDLRRLIFTGSPVAGQATKWIDKRAAKARSPENLLDRHPHRSFFCESARTQLALISMFFVAFVERRNYRFVFQAASSFSVHNATLPAVEREKMTTQPASGTIWKSGIESLRDRGSSPSQVGKIRLRSKPKGQIRRETILVLLKPDCLVACHCGDVLKRFEQAGSEIIGCKMTLLSDRVLAEHYAHVYKQAVLPGLEVVYAIKPGDRAGARWAQCRSPSARSHGSY
jgi:hypothetical protein